MSTYFVPVIPVWGLSSTGLADRSRISFLIACRRACALPTFGASRPSFSKHPQDDATILAIREQERAGLHIITDVETPPRKLFERFGHRAGRNRSG